MKHPFLILSYLIFALASCSHQQKNNTKKVITDTLIKAINSSKPCFPAHADADTTISQARSAIINGQHYTAIIKTNDSLYVCKNEDTILKVADIPGTISFEDFDDDGYKDIIISLPGNGVDEKELFLFDKHAQSFKRVADFSSFPAPISIPGTKYYYSYHRSGCADMNWDSDLFYIKTHKAIRIGNIAGRQCDKSDPEYGIYIHRVKKAKETLVKKLSDSTLHHYEDLKWGFIADYWTKNYKLFQ